MKIKFTTIQDIYDFMALMKDVCGTATLSQGRFIICAHSLLGVFSLDLRNPMDFVLESGNYEPFKRFATGN